MSTAESSKKLKEEARLSSSKKVIMFDLDGTLAESKADIDREMASLICQLLEHKIVAVVGGGKWLQLKNQFIDRLKCAKTRFENLFIFPHSGGSLYKYETGEWKLIYQNPLLPKEKKQILAAFRKAFKDIRYTYPQKTYGEVIEDREVQVTFSALGQKAPLEKKEGWNKAYNDIRFRLKTALEKYLPDFEIRLGGLTSIDVTKKGVDKAYGIKQLMKLLRISKDKIIYVGDALFRGGNDYVVKSVGIDTVAVGRPDKTKLFIRLLILPNRQ